MDLSELTFVELGEQNLDIELFDCGREDINEFFRNDAKNYQDECLVKHTSSVFQINPSAL